MLHYKGSVLSCLRVFESGWFGMQLPFGQGIGLELAICHQPAHESICLIPEHAWRGH